MDTVGFCSILYIEARMEVHQQMYIQIRITTERTRIIRKAKNLWGDPEQVRKVAEILLAKLWISLGIEATVHLVRRINEKR